MTNCKSSILARLSAANLPFNCPKAHSITFFALQSLYPKYCSCHKEPPFAYSFIRYGISGYAGSPIRNTGIGSSSPRIDREQLGICLTFEPVIQLQI